jgi:hypothetical protein
VKPGKAFATVGTLFVDGNEWRRLNPSPSSGMTPG